MHHWIQRLAGSATWASIARKTPKQVTSSGWLVLLCVLVLLPGGAVWAQEGAVEGTVVDAETEEPLPGVNVILQETQQGTATNASGEYEITGVEPGTYTLQATFVGYEAYEEQIEVAAGEATVVDIGMRPGAVELEEVAVTALGFQERRDEQGTASSSVSGARIAQSGETTVTKALSAKASGLNVTSAGGDPGSAARLVIRGNKSIQGDNQPLIVIDGVPVSNQTVGTAADGGQDVGGVQQQSRLNDLNPQDIASVEVLKGASAAALWGSRAQNGVIIIETQRGDYAQPMNVRFTSSVGSSDLNLTQDTQQRYGQGVGGVYVYNNPNSWGDRIFTREGGEDVAVTEEGQYFDGTGADLYNGVAVGRQTGTEYYPIPSAGAVDAQGNPLDPEHGGKRSTDTYDHGRDIFENGLVLENNLSVSGGSEDGRYYLSIGNVANRGIIPENSDFNRTSIRLNADRQFTDRFTMAATANFVRNNSNRTQQGSNVSGLLLGSYRTAPGFNNEDDYLVDYYPQGFDGPVIERRQRAYRNQIGENASPIYDNPTFVYNEIENATLVNRLTGKVEASYDVLEWFNLTARTGVDTYTDRRHEFFPIFNATQPDGQAAEAQYGEFRVNADLIGRANRPLTDDIVLDVTAGFSFNHRELDDFEADLTSFSNPIAVRSLENAEAQNVSALTDQEVRRTASVFGELDFGFYEQVFVELTGRLDQSSTFGPDADDTFFYPSVNVAWQFSDLMADGGPLSFGKLRASAGIVGREPGPYQAFTYFSPHDFFDGYLGTSLEAAGYGGGFQQDSELGNPVIQPEETREFEVGTDLRFFEDRLSFTANYYFSRSQDVIFLIDVAPSSGFASQLANAAEIENEGIELELEMQWPRVGDFQWDTDVSWWTNDNVVTNLAGVDEIGLAGFVGTTSSLVEGQPFGVLYGDTWRRAPEGCTESTPTQVCEPLSEEERAAGLTVAEDDRVLNANGFPILATNQAVVGNPQPDWRASIGNTLSWQGLSLYALFDFKIGGDVWNGTRGALYNFGVHGDQVWETTISADEAANLVNYLGLTPAELVATGSWPAYRENDDGSYTFRGYVDDFGAGPVIIDEYYFYAGPGGGFTGATDQFIEDGSYVKLREVTLSYDWQGGVLEQAGLSSVGFSLTGANLLTFTEYSGIDPETNLTGPSNGQGLDYFNNPNMRSYRFTVRLNY